MLGELSLNTTSTGNSGGVLGNLEGEISQIEGEIRGNASNSLSSAINDVAKVLNIHDFYSVHILDYVSGLWLPDLCALTLTFVLLIVRSTVRLSSFRSARCLFYIGLLRA